MQEEWKDVVGYEGVYQVSNFGNVKSLDRLEVSSRGSKRLRFGIMLKQKITEQGYATVHLRDKANDKESWPPVHRLVAKAMWLREQGFTLHKIGEIVGKNFSTVHNWCLERGLVNGR